MVCNILGKNNFRIKFENCSKNNVLYIVLILVIRTNNLSIFIFYRKILRKNQKYFAKSNIFIAARIN